MEKQTAQQFFPERLRGDWCRMLCENDKSDKGISWNTIKEIRLRVNQPVQLVTNQGKMELTNDKNTTVIYNEKDMDDIFRHLCQDSVYAYEEERIQGYMIINGGHRVGITGELAKLDREHYIVKYVRYINIRIAHEVKEICNSIMCYLYKDRQMLSTLIISPPGVGKTTLLRDIIRFISDEGMNVGVIDERGELAGAYRGSATLDCGTHTDVVTGGDKRTGTNILVRCFTPQVIAMDEIGNKNDGDAIFYAGVSGCQILATAHGRNLEDVKQKEELKQLIANKYFQRYLILTYKLTNDIQERYVEILDEDGIQVCGQKLLQQH